MRHCRDPSFPPLTVVLFWLADYRIKPKERWRWRDMVVVASSLTLITYGYFSAGVRAPLFALGLLFFTTTKHRLLGVVKIWFAYAVTLVPLILFNRSHSGVLTKRLWEVTYIKPGASWNEITSEFAEFVRCY